MNKSTNNVDSNSKEGFTTGHGENKEIKKPDYSEEEKSHLNTLIRLLCNTRQEREKERKEFDDMTYKRYYETNRLADLGYLPKKKNKEDKRVSTGLTRDKDNNLLSVLLKFNFESSIFAFNQDNFIISEMGSEMNDLVKKTREIEDYDEYKYYIYREYIAQGDVFVEEILDFPIETKKESSASGIKWVPGMKIASFKQTAERVKGIPVARTKVIPGLKVYLGDYKKENIKDQPYLFTYEEITRKEAELIYGDWDRWDNVPISIDTIESLTSTDEIGTKNWGFSQTGDNMVGIIKFQRKGTNEYQIMINGVLMLPLGYALTEVSPSGEYTLSQGKFEPIVNFSLSKSQPAKTKFDEDTLNEFYKLMVLKMQQSLKPPMGNKTGKIIDSSMFLPGKIVNDVSPKQLFPLFTSQGPTQGEFSFFNLVKTAIEDKTINRTFAGQSQEGNPTATQIIEEKQQQMLKLGLALDGIVNLEKQLIWKRIYTIINKYTDPVEKGDMTKNIPSIFRSFSYETEIDGEKGIKIFYFTDDEFPTERGQRNLEQDLALGYNKPVSLVLINPIMLKQLKAVWKIIITPTEKNNAEYDSLKLGETISQSYELFGGPEGHNIPYLRQRFANIRGIDSSKWFNNQPIEASVMAMDNKNNKAVDNKNSKTKTKPSLLQ